MVGGSLTSSAHAGAMIISASEARTAGESASIRRIMFPPTMFRSARTLFGAALLLKPVRHVGLGERRGARLHPAIEESFLVRRRIALGVFRPGRCQHILPLVEAVVVGFLLGAPLAGFL